MEPKRRRTGGRTARITRNVHEATLSALMESGLGRLTIEDIAARAGVNKVTIYRRWKTRERLVADALAQRFAGTIPVPDEGALRDDLVALAVRVRDTLNAPETKAILSALAGGGHGEDIDELRKRYWEQRFAAAHSIVDRAVARGEIGPGVDADALIIRIVGPVWFAVFGPGQSVSDNFIEQTVEATMAQVEAASRRSETSTPSRPDWGRWSTLS